MLILLCHFVFAQVPIQPQNPDHPSSAFYTYSVSKESLQIGDRKVDVFLPLEARQRGEKVPVVVFGHGQAIDVKGYELSFEHLAKKGVAVIHPMYETGFFDQNWRRMASDFIALADTVIQQKSDVLDSKQVVFSGHSKGAYVALVASGHPRLDTARFGLKSVVLFAPAGYDADYLAKIRSDVPVTLTWSDKDTVIKKQLIIDIYEKLQVTNKQWIEVKSYSTLEADHFYPLSKSFVFGGKNGVSAFHYYAVWKWLMGASFENEYLYGSETATTGVEGLFHAITKNY